MGFLLIAAVFLLLLVGPGLWVRRVIDRYSRPEDRYPGTGADLARELLDRHGIRDVVVEATDQGDHYDPVAKAVRLSPDKHDGRSLTAITVAAHEVGHAVQDHTGYGPLRFRTHLVRVVGPVQRIGAGALLVAPFLGMLTRVPSLGILMFTAGFLTMATSIVVHLATLPTEFDASFRRALPMLDRYSILKQVDRPHARRLLTAAALTYVSASLLSLLNVARWWAILRR